MMCPACVRPFGEPYLDLMLAGHMTLTHIQISFLNPSRLITVQNCDKTAAKPELANSRA
jgi:hypothetical protein